MEPKDLIIIGGGPGGYTAAVRAAQLGLKTVVIEKKGSGGTCLHRGCIPTKIYYRQAELLRTLCRVNDFCVSIDQNSVRFDWPAAVTRKNKIVAQMRSGIESLLKANQVDLVFGSASVRAPGKVYVVPNDETQEPFYIDAPKILLATGSENRPLDLPGIELSDVLDSSSILDLETIPRDLAIIGAGVIGIEFASIFTAFGSNVVLIEAADSVLPPFDRETSKRLTVYLKKQGVKIFTSSFLRKIEKEEGKSASVIVETKGKQERIFADKILIAVGRKPNTTGLGLEKLGIKMNGPFPDIDQNYETNIKGIYAVGDLAGRGMLAHLAAEEGKTAVERMIGGSEQIDYGAVPGCVFSFPEIAAVGMTQEQATEKNISVKIGKFLFAGNGKAQSMGETDGFVKVIAESERETILGVHIIGPHAADLILEGTVWVRNKMTVSEALASVHPHPTLGEALAEALLDVRQEAVHVLPKKFR